MRRVETHKAGSYGYSSYVNGAGEADTSPQSVRGGDMRMEKPVDIPSQYERRSWYLEKGISIPNLLMGLGQIIALVWWASNLSFRVDALEKQASTAGWQAEQIVRLQERVSTIQTGITEIKATLDKHRLDSRDNEATR